MNDWWDSVRAAGGIAAILGLVYALSENRRAISLRTVGWGLGLQAVFALLVLKLEWGRAAVRGASGFVTAVLDCAQTGAAFLFGDKLVNDVETFGFVFAFKVLPTVVFIAALFAVLYHLRIMPMVVKAVAWAMARLMGTSGAESLNAVAAVLIGQTESPLTIRPYLSRLTRSELLTVMSSGMAAVAGSVLVAYFATGADPRLILTAAIMAAPASIALSKILIPETGAPETLGKVEIHLDAPDANIIDAAARGTREGLKIALALAAMLISFLSLIALINLGLAQVGTSLERILGWLLSPVAWMMGVPWDDAPRVGGLLGLRLVTNEIVAYEQLKQIRDLILPRSDGVATFALCGFANVSSIGIQIGVVGALAPERRSELARLGPRALLVGTLANFLSACIAGILL